MAKKRAATVNLGASLSRQSVVAHLKRDRKTAAFDVAEYINKLLEWVSGQSLRAYKKKGGLGK